MISYADYTALQELPETELTVTHEIVSMEELVRVNVTISNPTDNIALAVNFRLREKATGREIIPVLYEDNYFPILPGETREITADCLGKGLTERDFDVVVDGWNLR